MEDFDGAGSRREAGRRHVFFAVCFFYSWAATLLFPFGVIRRRASWPARRSKAIDDTRAADLQSKNQKYPLFFRILTDIQLAVNRRSAT
jgi:hypothetical protein